jgi:hypothetical protein
MSVISSTTAARKETAGSEKSMSSRGRAGWVQTKERRYCLRLAGKVPTLTLMTMVISNGILSGLAAAVAKL